MKKFVCFLLLSFSCLSQYMVILASYQCGIRQHAFRPLIRRGWQVEEGYWPWHVAVFQRKESGVFRYGCGGTLVNEKHVLTAAHCVKRLLPKPKMYEIELHFGQHNLSKMTQGVQIRDVGKTYVHPEYAPQRNDIAVLVLRLPVEYSDTVIPICLDQKVDRDLRELEGQHGWVPGWGRMENGSTPEVLRAASLQVVSYLQCLNDDSVLFGKTLNENVFCAGNRNETNVGTGDSGGGMYFSDGHHWVLRGIVSFGKINPVNKEINPNNFIIFVNVQKHLTWIKEVFAESEPRRDRRQKRISELECEKFRNLSKKRINGDCLNNRFRHDVMLIGANDELMCNGALVEETHVITTCNCVRQEYNAQYQPAKVRIEAYGDVAISEMFCHPKHAYHRTHYDLAIVKFDAPVLLSNSLIPACLANKWTENLYDVLVMTYFFGVEHKTLVQLEESRVTGYEACHSLRDYEWFNRTQSNAELCVTSSDQMMYNTFPELSYAYSSAFGAVLQTYNRRSCMSTVVGLKVHNEENVETGSRLWYEVHARISHHLDWIEQSIWNPRPKEHIRLSFPGWDDICGFYHHAHDIEDWPWNVAIFHRNANTSISELACSGTLISAKHVLTTAECVVNHTTGTPLPEDTFELQFNLEDLNQRSLKEKLRYVSEVHVHANYSVHNVAILVTSWPVSNTHICLGAEYEEDLWKLEDQTGYVTGWQTIGSGIPSDKLQSHYISILSRQECSNASLELHPNQYCTTVRGKPSIADRGSGFHHDSPEETQRNIVQWVLLGIVSSEVVVNGSKRYTVLISLQPYIAWMQGVMERRESKRISERECQRFSSVTRKAHGVCENDWNSIEKHPPHIVTLYSDDQDSICLGVFVKEDRILTSCQCVQHPNRPTKAKTSSNGDFDVLETACHPEYNSTTFNADLAILKLGPPIRLSNYLVPACLANVRTENLEEALLQTRLDKHWKNEYLTSSSYDYIGTVHECNKLMSAQHDDRFLVPSQACIANRIFAVDKFKGTIVQSVDSRECRFTVVAIGSTAKAIPDDSMYPLKIGIVHRVAHHLDWIEQAVWGEK